MQTTGRLRPAETARQTWLNYYNDYLRAQGCITEDEWRRMRYMIQKT